MCGERTKLILLLSEHKTATKAFVQQQSEWMKLNFNRRRKKRSALLISSMDGFVCHKT